MHRESTPVADRAGEPALAQELSWARAARQVERSGSWRIGSSLVRAARRLTFRRPASPQGPAELAESIEGHADSAGTRAAFSEVRQRHRQWARTAREIQRSRSWRIGSFLVRMLRLLTFRRPASPRGPAELAASIQGHVHLAKVWLSADVLLALGSWGAGDGALDLEVVADGEPISAERRLHAYERADGEQLGIWWIHLSSSVTAPAAELRLGSTGSGSRVASVSVAALDPVAVIREDLALATRSSREGLLEFLVDSAAGTDSLDPGPLSHSLRAIRDTLRESASHPLVRTEVAPAIGVNTLVGIDDRTLYVRGWVLDGPAATTRVTAVSPEGARISVLEQLHRVYRPDVDRAYGTAGGREAKHGFLGCFETPVASRVPDGWIFEAENSAGAVAEAQAPPVMVDPEAARAIIVTDLAGESGPESPLMDHVGPGVSTLQRRLAEGVEIDGVEEYGRVPKRPVASLLVTLYKRTDLLELQLAQFAQDESLREAELIYVIDSPELVAEVLSDAAELHQLYGVPIRVTALSRHAGFAAAVNNAARIARGPQLLIMHSDVLPVNEGWLPRMLAAYQSVEGVGALGPKLLYEDGTLQHAGIRFERRSEDGAVVWDKVHRFKGLDRGLPAAREPGPVPAVADACLMIDRTLFDELDGLSVDYWPGGYEDTDLCFRVRETGREVWYEPTVELYHLEGRSYAPHASDHPGSRYSSWLHTRRWAPTLERRSLRPRRSEAASGEAVRSSGATEERGEGSVAAEPQLELVGLTQAEVPAEILHGKSLGVPESAGARNGGGFRVVGWVLPVAGPAREVEILCGDRLVARAESGLERPEVADAFPHVPHARSAGFEASVNLLALRDGGELSVRAVIDGPRNVGLGSVRVRRHRARDEPQLVSVVIPCYDQAHFLGEAIESVITQTHSEVEVVVVNDGSRDNTSEVAARYLGVVLVEQPNRGVAIARNAGLRKASGDLLIFLDADDRLLDHAIETGLSELEGRPDAACAVGASRNIGPDGQVLPGDKQPLVTDNHYERLLAECFIWAGSSIVHRRQAVEQVGGFNPERRAGDDYELYLNLARQFPMVSHDAVVTECRRHGSNMTRDTAVILTSESSVLNAQRQHLRNERERLAWHRGLRRVREEHGGSLLRQMRELQRAGETRLALRHLASAVKDLYVHR